MVAPARIIGVDFSGAADAGRAIWIAAAHADDNRLIVDRLECLADVAGRAREVALPALRARLSESPAAIGIDAPFSLAAPLVDEDWPTFVLRFGDRYPSAEVFRSACRAASSSELRRRTDRDTKTPFAPTNLRLYRQTFHAIRDVIAPLIREGAVALPMQAAWPGVPWLLEVCPASTLKAAGLYLPYKGRGEPAWAQRGRLLDWLVGEGVVIPESIRDVAIENREGDALDALICAYTVWQVLPWAADLQVGSPYDREGFVLVSDAIPTHLPVR